MDRGRERYRDDKDERDVPYEEEYDEGDEPYLRRRVRSIPTPRSQRPHTYVPRSTRRLQPSNPVDRRSQEVLPRHVREYADAYAPVPRRPHYAPRQVRSAPYRQRSIWPILLGGCAIGIVFAVIAAAVVVVLALRVSQGGKVQVPGIGGGGAQTFTQNDTQTATLPSLTQLQICDKIGNVSVSVDPNADNATITTKKSVQATSKSEADQEFKRIVVEVQPPGPIQNMLTCAQQQNTVANRDSALIVNTTIPNSDGIIRNTPDAVDINVTVPQKALANDTTPLQLDIEAPFGNITVDGLSGVLNVQGSNGNVKVTQALLISGSNISSTQGDVTFNGRLAVPNDTEANYHIKTGKGKVDVTLPTTTAVILDAFTNSGPIHSDFPINTTKDGDGTAYRGPLNTSASTQSTAVLSLIASTGEIDIHKAAATP